MRQTLLLIYQHHQGGIPGFAANPFPSLRGQSQSLMLGSLTQWRRLLPGAALKIQIREKKRRTFDAATPFLSDTLESFAYNLVLAIQSHLYAVADRGAK